MVKIFDIINDRVVLNENILLIKEFKKLYEKHEGDLSPFCFIHFRTHPKSPFRDYDEKIKDELLKDEFPGDYNIESIEMQACIAKCEDMYKTVRYRFWEGLKKKLEEFTYVMNHVKLNMDKEEGNFNEMIKLFEKVDKLFIAYEKAEKAKEDELKTRGNQQLAYDQV